MAETPKQREERKLREQIERNTKRAAELNSRIVPDTPNHVRIDGPRRQYNVTVRANGMLHFDEI